MSFPRRTKFEGERFTEIDFGPDKRLIQNTEIGHLLTKSNRRLFLKLVEKAISVSGKQQEGGMSIELISKRSDRDGTIRYYFKMQLDEGVYFVKKTPRKAVENYGGGAKEIADMVEVKRCLSDPDVGVMEYHVGYEDAYNTYLVSRWNDAYTDTLENYLGKLRLDPARQEEYRELVKRKNEVHDDLRKHFFDAGSHNMVYDPKNKKIIVFDLIKKPN